eukprot:43634-Rhodomonas_salina.4
MERTIGDCEACRPAALDACSHAATMPLRAQTPRASSHAHTPLSTQNKHSGERARLGPGRGRHWSARPSRRRKSGSET